MTNKKIYSFTITGNPDNLAGNPIPYFRIESRSKFSNGARRYYAWKDAIVSHFLQHHPEFYDVYATQGKPIYLGKDGLARMDLHIVWCNEAHSDPDNVFKGLADALFVNDKHLAGGFTFEHGVKGTPGRVEVKIQLDVATK